MPLLVGHVDEVGGAAQPGVVDDDVEMAHRVGRRREQPLHIGLARDVARDRQRTRAHRRLQLLGGLGQSPFVAVADDDERAFLRAPPRRRLTDAGARGRGDQHRSPLEQVVRRRRVQRLAVLAHAGLPRQAEHALADHIALDLVGAAVDGVRTSEQEHSLQLVVELEAGPEHVDRQLTERPVPRGPVELGDRRLRPRCPALHRAQRAQRVEPHDAQPEPRVGQPPAHHRIARRAVRLGDGDDLLQLALEPELNAEGGHASLESEQAHRHPPASVHLADDVVARGARAVEEHLAELRRAGELHDRPDLDTCLAHGTEDERDPLVLRRRRIGATDDEAPVGPMGERRPHLLAGDRPLVAVENGLRLDVGEVGARVRLRVALTPHLFPRDDRRKVTAAAAQASRTRSTSVRAGSRRPRRPERAPAPGRTPR